ncbi:MAG: Gfo/Idh/MocA family oxidoreductase [Bacteroidetes bacterium]|nr:Gfo/Idh/MocA family oxidoreductase [Bacteroidota bacterium]
MNIAVVGCGWWGKNIINTLEEIELVKTVHIFDSDKESYAKFIRNRKVVFRDSLQDICNDPSIIGVCISTPPPTHYELTKLFLVNKKNVFVEKPPAYDVLQLKELGNLATQNNLIYMLDALYLFQPPLQKIKKIFEEENISDITSIQLFRIGDELRRSGAGLSRIQNTMFKNMNDVIDDLFFHDAGILIHLLGKVELIAIDKLFLYDDKLCDTARIKFAKNNIDIEMTLSWTLVGRKRGVVIYAKDSIIEYDALKTENQISVYSLSEMEYQYFNFINSPPLRNMLDYFTTTILNKSENFLDHNFMMSIMELLEKIRYEK